MCSDSRSHRVAFRIASSFSCNKSVHEVTAHTPAIGIAIEKTNGRLIIFTISQLFFSGVVWVCACVWLLRLTMYALARQRTTILFLCILNFYCITFTRFISCVFWIWLHCIRACLQANDRRERNSIWTTRPHLDVCDISYMTTIIFGVSQNECTERYRRLRRTHRNESIAARAQSARDIVIVIDVLGEQKHYSSS